MAKLTNKGVAEALNRTHGNIAAAARMLGVERNAIAARIRKNPALGQAVIDARETMVDNAESSLNRGVLAGEGWAVCFTLKTQGKSRGYIERSELDVSDIRDRMVLIEEIVESAPSDTPASITPGHQTQPGPGTLPQ